ncbi:YgaP-like transmembrane domain [Legionella drancourtii]|nr:YgaP-like transmembrane domain [Legionella drancourtii]
MVTVLVGANFFQSGFTGFCPHEMILKRIIG